MAVFLSGSFLTRLIGRCLLSRGRLRMARRVVRGAHSLQLQKSTNNETRNPPHELHLDLFLFSHFTLCAVGEDMPF